MAVSTLLAASFNRTFYEKCAILGCGALGGAFLDLDAMTLWSGFDPSFGRLYHLHSTGKQIYFGNYWYSHHNFFSLSSETCKENECCFPKKFDRFSERQYIKDERFKQHQVKTTGVEEYYGIIRDNLPVV